MAFHANWDVVEDTPDRLTIRDLGSWHLYKTITNDAENVVNRLAPILKGRRLFYIDSDGDKDELIVTPGGKFGGFKSCCEDK